MNKTTNDKIISVSQQVIEQFLRELESQKVPEEVIERLRKTLVEDEKISVEALKVALLSANNIKA